MRTRFVTLALVTATVAFGAGNASDMTADVKVDVKPEVKVETKAAQPAPSAPSAPNQMLLLQKTTPGLAEIREISEELPVTVTPAAKDKTEKAEKVDPPEPSYELWVSGKSVLKLENIGGKPEIVTTQKLKGPNSQELLEVRYEAGSGGTKTITEVERVALVLVSGPSAPKLFADLLVSIRRVEGEKELLSQKRTLKWSADHATLQVPEFDDEPETHFTWKGDEFQSKEIVPKTE